MAALPITEWSLIRSETFTAPLFTAAQPTTVAFTNLRPEAAARWTIWIADAHREDVKPYAVRAVEKLTAFLELEAVIPSRSFHLDRSLQD